MKAINAKKSRLVQMNLTKVKATETKGRKE
jgi:hypothetical protein